MSLDTNNELIQHTEELVSLVIQNFQDQSSSHKRIVALNTLGQLIVKTGKTTTPNQNLYLLCLAGVPLFLPNFSLLAPDRWVVGLEQLP